MSVEQISLPGCDTPTAPLGVGTWAWGDKATWGMGGYDPDLTEATIAEAWEASVEAGVTLFDTAEVYGGGESERIIGRLLARDPDRRASLVLATKFMPMPYKLHVKGALRAALRRSIERLGVDHVDLYQIHGPISLRSNAGAGRCARRRGRRGPHPCGRRVELLDEGDRAHPRRARRATACRWPRTRSSSRCCAAGPRPPACSRRAGAWASCSWPTRRSGWAGSPASTRPRTRRPASGTSPPTRWRRSTRSSPSCAASAATHGRTPSQVALRWLIDKGAVPIPGAKNGEQARQNAGALGWHARPTTRWPSSTRVADRPQARHPEPHLAARLRGPPTVPACDHLQFWRHLPAETAKGTR